MAGLGREGTNPDVSLFHDINGLASSAPPWFNRAVEFAGQYGIITAIVLLMLWCWWTVRRLGDDREAGAALAALVWTPFAAGAALLVNIPIRDFVERPRPFREHQGIEVLVGGETGFSFVSDHATMAMALGVGLFMAHRRIGLAAIGLALVEGCSRVYLGGHYPTDVVGGFALGTAVTLLFAPLALALLNPPLAALARSGRAGWLVRSRRAVARSRQREHERDQELERHETGLAA
ncbi:phosphatase PAP2 family protein [Streptomyces sp. SCSIO 30461]|uniref:phosphatase PAP2 family protein n=1 Tax=Streptomyces sp. SCSIO 30461 TaxID=3118085 RepID=UPI0030D03711